MINNDSIVTAYDEHLTLVEWLQKIEKLLANGGLKTTSLNDKGNATFSLTLTFNDDTTIESPDMTLTSVNEALTFLNNEVANLKDGTTPLFETITDDEGNYRFVEGNITMETITGITQTYGKWSLSGTHLMIVIAFDIASGVATPINATLAKFTLPDFIYAKIIRLWDYAVNVLGVTVRQKSAWYNSQSLQSIQLYKLNNPAREMEIKTSNSTITASADSACRIQFDLIIDNE